MKRVLAMLISVALVATLAVGGSIAYLTDTDGIVNVMEVGNVHIKQIELERNEGIAYDATAEAGDLKDFEQGQKLYPAVWVNNKVEDYKADDGAFVWGPYVTEAGASNQLWADKNLMGTLDKFVFVENTGVSPAYYRTVLAFECPDGMNFGEAQDLADEVEDKPELMMNINTSRDIYWQDIGTAKIEGSTYLLKAAVYKDALQPKEISEPSLLQVAMTHEATNAHMEMLGEEYQIMALTQAVQVDNMDVAYQQYLANGNTPYDGGAAAYALDKAFGKLSPENHPWLGGIFTIVTTNDELQAAIEAVNVKNIAVQGDLTYDWGGAAYENSKALLMEGKTFFGADKDASLTFAGYGSANPIKGVTLKDITIKDETVGDNEGAWEHGHLEFESLIASNVRFDNSIMLSGESKLINCTMDNKVAEWYGAWVEGGNTTFKDCTFSGTRAIKIHEAYGTDVASVTVDNCNFDLTEKPGVVIGDVNAATSVSITNSYFDCMPGEQDKYIYETDTDITAFRFTEENNTVSGKVAVKTIAELNDAIAAGKKKILLQEYTGSFPASSLNEDVTLICENTKFKGKSSLNINGATVVGATFSNPSDSAVDQTINGTFKDCTFDGYNGLRWCYAGETVVFENCEFTGDLYGAHFDGGANDIIFKNCTFSGFNTFAAKVTKLTLEGCTFKANGRSVYNGINLFGNSVLTDCTFVFDGTADNEWVDLCGNNKTVTFTNCVVTDGTTETPLKDVVGNYGDGNTITIDGVTVDIPNMS